MKKERKKKEKPHPSEQELKENGDWVHIDWWAMQGGNGTKFKGGFKPLSDGDDVEE